MDWTVKEYRKGLIRWFGRESKPVELSTPKLVLGRMRFYDGLKYESREHNSTTNQSSSQSADQHGL